MKHFLLRGCLRAYPRAVRERRGTEILDLAQELSSSRSWDCVREAGGLLAGGLQARAALLRLDLTGAPWRAAQERLVLPVAVALLCLASARVGQFLLYYWYWVGWWAVVMLVTCAGTVVAVLARRRGLAVAGSLAVLGLVVLKDAVALATQQWQWSGAVSFDGAYHWWGAIEAGSSYQVSLFAMWLPVAALLAACAPAVNSRPFEGNGRARIFAPILLALASLCLARWLPLGIVFVYAPLALVLATAIWGVMTRNRVFRTAAALLVAACCFPALWLIAFVVPYPSALEPYFPFLFYAAGWMVAFVLMRLLLLDHRLRSEQFDSRRRQPAA